MFDFCDRLPVERQGIADVQRRLGGALEDDVKPVIRFKSLGGIVIIGCKGNFAGKGAALDLNEPNINRALRIFGVRFSGNEIETAIVCFDAFDDAPLGFLVFDGELDGNLFNIGVADHGCNGLGLEIGMRQNPSAGKVLDVADHALALALQFGAALVQPGVQLVNSIFSLLEIGSQGLGCVVPLVHFVEVSQTDLLAIDQLVEADFNVLQDRLSLSGALGGDFRKHRVERGLN